MGTKTSNPLEAQITSLFLEESDIFQAVKKLRNILQTQSKIEAVEFVLKADKQYRQISDSHDSPLAADDPFVQNLVNQPLDIEMLGWQPNYQDFKPDLIYLIPLIFKNDLYGWITFHHSDSEHRLSERLQTKLQSASQTLTVGLRHLYSDYLLRERIEELTVVNIISKTMNSSLNVKETLESVMDAVITYTHPDRALMYLRDEDRGHFVPTIGRGITAEALSRFEVETEDTIFQHAILNREPLVVEDIDSDPRVKKELAKKVKTKAFAVVPIISKEQVIGIITVDNFQSGRPLSEIDIDLLVTLANHAAIALSNSRLFEKTQRFNEELQERIKEATAHLERLLEMKSHFITVASHQLRTPLTVVKGMLSMLVEEDDIPEADQKKMLTHAYSSTNRLERIVSELLTAAELEDTKMRLQYEEVEPDSLIEQILTEVRPLALKKGVALEKQLDNDTTSAINTDRHRLYEALANLVDNAVRYTADGKVTVVLEQRNGQIHFHVADTGIGLEPHEHDEIFEKFHRGEQALEHEPNGSGLGLFITKQIIENLEGEIIVHSEGRGKGTTFMVILPSKK